MFMKKIISLLLAVFMLFSAGFNTVSAADVNPDKLTSNAISQIYPEAFEAIAESLRNHDIHISIKEYYILKDELPKIFESVILENPDIFYVNPYMLDYAVNVENGYVSHIKPYYIFDVDTLPEKIQQFDDAVEYYLSGVDENWSNYKKCRYIHDLLATTVEYDMDYNNDADEVFTAYGALVENVSISQGYTLAYNYLLSKLGIKAYFIQNDEKYHSWSMVKLGSNYYHVDIVGDDPVDDLLGRTLHNYCLISDKKLKKLRKNMNWIADFEATNTKYDNAWWSSIDTFIFTVDDKDYYVDNNYNNGESGAFLSYEESTDTHNLVYKIEDKWYIDVEKNKFWSGSFSSLVYDGNLFYFNTPDAVYSIKPSGKGKTLFYQRSKTQNLDIFGIATLSDGRIYAEYQQDPMTNGIVYAVDSKESIYKVGDVNTDGITDINDVTRLQKHLISQVIMSSKQIALADYNKDDAINVKDVTAIQKILANVQ